VDYPEYERQQELACVRDHIPEYMQAIFDDAASGSTLAHLQHRIYKDTDAGISISFQLDDGTFLWTGDKRLLDNSLVNRVSQIGFSSIVEGSDAEVGLRWLDLLDEQWETPELVVAEFNRLVDETNDEACRLWDEEHGGDNGDDVGWY
jgi:hypothetical protein